MKHHANKFGVLRSDEEQSIGGMNLWKSLYHEKDSKFSFFHHEKKGEKDNKETYDEHKIDDDYFKKKENIIWDENDKLKGTQHRVAIKPNV
jgi:hypothetical protein